MICYLFPEPTYFFFSTDVPTLLYYAQIPATVVALLFSFYAFWQGRSFLLNRLLLAISIFFSLWTISTLIAWTNVHSNLIIFIWSFFSLILGLISIYCIYFIYVFLRKTDVSGQIKGIFFLLLSPILLLSTTNYNLSGFNLTNCDAFEFEWLPFKAYGTFLGILAMVWIFILLVKYYKLATPNFKKQIVLMGVGIELFLFSFFGMEFVATYLTKIGLLPDSQLELYGLFGMVIFMIYITILMVRFSAFNIKLIATQALIWGLSILIGSQFFFVKTKTNFFLTGVTFVASIIFGYFLIQSVKREIEARMRIEELAKDLQKANEGQTNLIHIMNHQIKGYLAKARGIFSELLLEPAYGPVSDLAKPMIKEGFDSLTEGVGFVQQVLNGSSAESGTLVYSMNPVDIKALVEEVSSDEKEKAQKKGLSFEVSIADGSYTANADPIHMKEAIRNLIENSIIYTPTGGLTIHLENKDGKIQFSVKDTGLGINPEDKAKLFTKGGRGKDSLKVNVNSTGYGLAFVKGVAEAHKGRVWVESEGAGKGSTFYLEILAA